jgi:hypothetical protein
MTWSKEDLDRAVRAYSENLLIVPRYRELIEVTAFLVNRDIIQESLAQGLILSASQQKAVSSADAQLIELCPALDRRFPDLFDDRGAPPSYWWWHPNGGPQGRSQPLVASDRHAS